MIQQAINYGDEAELVRSIDDSLVYRANMYAKGSSCLTLQVEKDGRKCVLKIRKKTNNMWDDLYFFYETHALKRAMERKVAHVGTLLAEYDNGTYHAILKPFIEGRPGNTFDREELLNDPEFIAKLDQIYLALHLAGISNVKFLPRKVVITDDNEVILVDLSTCLVNTEVGILQFNQTMRDDSGFITRLERNIKRNARLAGKTAQTG